eukprot:171641_1
MGCVISKNNSKSKVEENKDATTPHFVKLGRGTFGNVVKNLKKALGDEYEIVEKPLGISAMGCNVRKVIHKSTGEEFACKTFNIASIHGKKKQNFAREMLRNEIAMVKSLDHPNIIRGKEIREDMGNLHFIMELCHGKHLGFYKYTELQACFVAKSLIRALMYVHSRGIVHRDLKMENVMWENKTNDGRIKLIDFGMSTHCMQGALMSDCVGTPYTMAPEVLIGSYSEKADIWSLGAMIFNLIAGVPAFEMPGLEETLKRILNVTYIWPDKLAVSSEAKELVYNMLKFNPDKRWTLQQALESRWIKKYDAEVCAMEESSLILQPNVIPRIVESMRDYNTYSMFKKTILLVMAVRAEPFRMHVLSDAFIKFDNDHSGIITNDELKRLLSQDPNVSDDEAAAVFKSVDINNTGSIQFLEFLAATVESVYSLDGLGGRYQIGEQKLKETFEYMDVDSSGEISVENMRALFGPSVPEIELIQIMNGIRDVDEDTQYPSHVIDYSSFLELFQHS